MKKILLSGCAGKMCRVIADCVSQREDCSIAAGVDIHPPVGASFPVFDRIKACDIPCDCIIDFSHPSALSDLLEYGVQKKIPLVLATTGYSQQQVDEIHNASQSTAIFFTANMSLGINLMVELAKKAASVLGRDFDIEIIEKHHNQKIDAPSGTALMLADAVAGALPQKPVYVYDRHSKREKRTKNEIGIHSIRGGTITGEHEILFAGRDEFFSLCHSAATKEVFAVGALNAALFLIGKQPGLYQMSDLL